MLGQHQASSISISITHHASRITPAGHLYSCQRRRQLLNAQGPKPCRCAPCKPRLSTASTAPHHTTTTTTNLGWPSSIDLDLDLAHRPPPPEKARLTTTTNTTTNPPAATPPSIHDITSIEGIHDAEDNGGYILPHPAIAPISSHPIPFLQPAKFIHLACVDTVSLNESPSGARLSPTSHPLPQHKPVSRTSQRVRPASAECAD